MAERFRFSGSLARVASSAAIWAAVSSGCGSGDFVPPPPPELKGPIRGTPESAVGRVTAPALPSPSTGVRNIELILTARADPEDTEIEKSAARVQAGLDKARIKITVVGEEPASGGQEAPKNPSAQAKLVREAVARHPQALIVELADPADRELVQAVQEARAAKVPVVLLGRALSAEPNLQGANQKTSSANLIVVAPPPFADSARQLVASAIRNARNAKLNPEGGALIMVNTAGDPLIADRVAAIREALTATGIIAIDEIRFMRDFQAGKKLLVERLRSDPKPTLVLSADAQGTSAANQGATEIAGERPFIQAGYVADDHLSRLVAMGEFGALAEFATTRLTRKAVSTAVAAAQGRDVASRVELPVVIQDSPPKSGAPGVQARYQARKKPDDAKEPNSP
jgi:ABC-type sugar transport system substrate-binding protein